MSNFSEAAKNLHTPIQFVGVHILAPTANIVTAFSCSECTNIAKVRREIIFTWPYLKARICQNVSISAAHISSSYRIISHLTLATLPGEYIKQDSSLRVFARVEPQND